MLFQYFISELAPSLNLQIVRNPQMSPQRKQMVFSGNPRTLLSVSSKDPIHKDPIHPVVTGISMETVAERR